MSFVALVGGFALYLAIPFVLDLWLREASGRPASVSGGSLDKRAKGTPAGSLALGADAGSRASLSLAERRQQRYETMWAEIKGSISGGKLRAFRDSGLPSPVVPFDWLPKPTRDLIIEADMNRLLGPKDEDDIYADGDIISDITEKQAKEPPERQDGDDPESWQDDDDA